jgi:hypothetical protein
MVGLSSHDAYRGAGQVSEGGFLERINALANRMRDFVTNPVMLSEYRGIAVKRNIG